MRKVLLSLSRGHRKQRVAIKSEEGVWSLTFEPKGGKEVVRSSQSSL